MVESALEPRRVEGIHSMKRLFWICVGILGLLVLLGSLLPDNSAEKEAAIDAVKQHYQPTARLAVLNPDFAHASWSALPLSNDMCSYDDCYEVLLETYMTDDGEEKPLEAKWYVSVKEQKYQPTNREARIYFELKPTSP